jgi:hypothetical protein
VELWVSPEPTALHFRKRKWGTKHQLKCWWQNLFPLKLPPRTLDSYWICSCLGLINIVRFALPSIVLCGWSKGSNSWSISGLAPGICRIPQCTASMEAAESMVDLRRDVFNVTNICSQSEPNLCVYRCNIRGTSLEEMGVFRRPRCVQQLSAKHLKQPGSQGVKPGNSASRTGGLTFMNSFILMTILR